MLSLVKVPNALWSMALFVLQRVPVIHGYIHSPACCYLYGYVCSSACSCAQRVYLQVSMLLCYIVLEFNLILGCRSATVVLTSVVSASTLVLQSPQHRQRAS